MSSEKLDPDSPVVQLVVFGDSTYDVISDLEALLAQKHAYVSIFFDEAYQALSKELYDLTPERTTKHLSFSTLKELVALRREDLCPPCLHQALTLICQLGLYLREHDSGGIQWFEGNVATLGFCTGSLSAAVVSGSNSLQSFLRNAARAVAVATRLGVLTTRVSHALELADAEPGSWSFALPGESSDEVNRQIQNFVREKSIPPLSRPYISAYAHHGVTISGPPRILKQLRGYVTAYDSRARELSLFAPYHAPHLYADTDVEWILEAVDHEPWFFQSTKTAVISSVTGKEIWTGSYRPLLSNALQACLRQPLRIDLVHTELPSTLRAQGACRVEVIAIGSDTAPGLHRQLRSIDQDAVLRVCSMTSRSSCDMGDESSHKIAIVGMSGRFPEAENTEELWNLLSQGLDICSEAPPTRWDVGTHVDSSGKTKNASAVRWGCWLQNAGLYDPRFFGMSPKEAEQCDPQQRLATMAAYEAMEEAGIVVGRTPSTRKDRIGVFLGSTSCDWLETNSSQDISTFFIPGGNRAFSPGRVNYVFNLCGPSYSIDTACSSSLAAIHLACNALWSGDCDTAIAGGTNMVTNPDCTTGLDRGFFLSRTGNCKTFDETADGYCRGEAAGVLIFKRLAAALADRDPILGVILGVNTNHSAESEAIVRPHAGAQSALMRKVLNNAGIHSHEISYVEMHGTGTQTGDAVEMESVLSTVVGDKTSPGGRSQPVYIGSIKPNIGHGEAASGASALIKVLLMMQHSKIPPHAGIKTKINPNFPKDLEGLNVHIARSLVDWLPLPGHKRRALVNNFSAAGGNTALVLEDAPTVIENTVRDLRASHVVTVSAKSVPSLGSNLSNIIRFVKEGDQKDELLLPRLSYTTTARRAHYPFRAVVTGSSLKDIAVGLQNILDGESWKTRSFKKVTILMTFTGQGAQYPGMGRQLYDTCYVFRLAVQSFDQLAQRHGFPSFLSIFSENLDSLDGLEPITVQIATVALEVALARLLAALGVYPSAVIGHSLGQYAALCVANVLSDSDMIYLVGTRAQLLQQKCSRATHSMLAAKTDEAKLRAVLDHDSIDIACINGPNMVVLAGTNSDVKAWRDTLIRHNIQTKILDTDYAFHSAQADPILVDFDSICAGIHLREPSIPIICPLECKVITDLGHLDSSYFSRHCRRTVDVLSALKVAQNTGLINEHTMVIEAGPHPTVSPMVKATICPTLQCNHILAKHQDAWTCLNNLLAVCYKSGLDINWDKLHSDHLSAQQVVKLPSYAWDLKNYWLQYTGDWSLRKGMSLSDIKIAYPDHDANQGSATNASSGIQTISNAGDSTLPDPAEEARFESTTVHRIIGLTSDGSTAELVVEADITRDDLYAITQGHKVDGVPLSTPSVWAEMATNVGKYLMDRFRPEQAERLVDVAKLVVDKPLIPLSRSAKPEPQLVRCKATVDWTTKSGKCLFTGVEASGTTHTEYGWCDLIYRDRSRLNQLQTELPVIRDKIKSLARRVADGRATRFTGASAYKMVGSLASFHPDFRGIKEVILDGESLELLATLDFTRVKRDGTFITHPAAIDAMTQNGGFIMNAKDSTDLEREVYFNHGWDSAQIFEPISLDKAYKVYTKMGPLGNSLWAGDNFVWDGDRLVALLEGVTVRKIPRKAMTMILDWTKRQERSRNHAPGEAKPSTLPPEVRSVAKIEAQSNGAPKSSAPQTVSTPSEIVSAGKVSVPIASTGALPSKFAKALEIIAEETGVTVADLTDDSALEDIGVDSLLSMVITSRYREELNLDFDQEMTIFTDFPTIRALRNYIASVDGSAQHVVLPQVSSTADTPNRNLTVQLGGESCAMQETPLVSQSDDSVRPAEGPSVTPESTLSCFGGEDMSECFPKTLTIISEESGIAVGDLTDNTAFSDVGIDSLLSMVLISRLREELALDIDQDTMLFEDLPTVGDLRRWFSGNRADPVDTMIESSSESSNGSGSSTPQTSDDEKYEPISLQSSSREALSAPRATTMCKATTSVILQGKPGMAKKTLFLFPDGGGSASSYIALQRLGEDIAVVGLNSPYARDPENMNCKIDALIDSYVREIRRRQPSGPYNLGGWSSGAVFAYIASSVLASRGETVESLALIDAPTPGEMDELPMDFFDWAEQLRNVDKAAAPHYLVPHFKATTQVMVGYNARPIHHPVKVLIVWASNGMMNGRDLPRYQLPPGSSSKGLGFLLDDKTDFGPRGWDKLLPNSDITIQSVHGANHFTLMSQRDGNVAFVRQVASAISELLS